jgi:signal recognition particle receptor subunit alpha
MLFRCPDLHLSMLLKLVLTPRPFLPALLSLVQGLGLVFVAVYQKTLSLTYVDELLQQVRDAFVSGYQPSQYQYDNFTPTFREILLRCEAAADAARRPQQLQQQRGSTTGKAAAKGSKGGQQPGKQGSSAAKGKQSSEDEDEADTAGNTGSSEESSAANSEEEGPAGKVSR